MIDVEKFNLKITQGNPIYFSNSFDIEILVVIVFLSFQNHSPGQFSGINGGISKLWNNVGDSSNVVIVAVSDENSPNVFLLAFEIFNVGNNIVNAHHFFFWKHKTNINDDNIVSILKNCHISANFFQAPQGNYP